MSRTLKQFVYTLLCIGIVVLLVWFFFSLFSKPAATCTDGIQNQEETGIDCGGPCDSCELKSLEPIEVLDSRALSLRSGKTAILIHIQNPNQNYRATFDYHIGLFDERDIERGSINGSSRLYAGEEKYILEPNDGFSNPNKIMFRAENISWESSASFPNPVLKIENATTSVDQGVVRISGAIRNMSSVSEENVGILAILYTTYGEELFSAKTNVTRVQGLSTAPFLIQFPNDEEIIKRLKNDATRIIVSSE